MTPKSKTTLKFKIAAQKSPFYEHPHYYSAQENIMNFFKKIKDCFSIRSKVTQHSISKEGGRNREVIQQLSTAELLEVAGGPQVRNETDI